MNDTSSGTKNNPTLIYQPCGCQTDDQIGTPDYRFVYSGSDNIWQAGRKGWVEVMIGSSVLKSMQFQVN